MERQVDRIMDEEEQTSRDTGDGVIKWKSVDDRREVHELCREAVRQLEDDLDALLGLFWKPKEQQCGWDPAPRFEVPLLIPHPAGHRQQILLVGEIDLLVLRPEGWLVPAGVEVWDLKTTKDDQYWRKTLGQLLFYEVAVWVMKKGTWPVRSGLLQPLCDDTAPSWKFTQDHRIQMFQRIVQTATDIWEGRVAPKKDSAGCSYCEVRHACSKYSTVRGRAKPGAVPGI